MEVNVTNVTSSANRCTYELHHLTDLHRDDPDHCHRQLDERIREIADNPLALWIGGGDYGSLILPGDRRFGSGGHIKDDWADHLSRLPDYYLDRCTELFEPIKDKCLGLVAGNHEATIGRNYHRGLVAELAYQLGKPGLYLGDRGWSIVRFATGTNKLTMRVFSYHGWSAGRLGGRKMIQAERDLGAWDADVFLLGHDHQAAGHVWWTQSCDHKVGKGYVLTNRPRAVLNGGSWTIGQKPPTPEREKIGWKPATMPGQSWVEGKNYRPQGPSNPTLLVHVDHGNGARSKAAGSTQNGTGRPAGFDLEIRWRADRLELDAA